MKNDVSQAPARLRRLLGPHRRSPPRPAFGRLETTNFDLCLILLLRVFLILPCPPHVDASVPFLEESTYSPEQILNGSSFAKQGPVRKRRRRSRSRSVQQTALRTAVASWVLIISLLGDLRLSLDLGTGSGKFGFLGVEWVVSETKPLRPSGGESSIHR